MKLQVWVTALVSDSWSRLTDHTRFCPSFGRTWNRKPDLTSTRQCCSVHLVKRLLRSAKPAW